MSVIQNREMKKKMRLARKVDAIMKETQWNGLRTAKNQRLLSYLSIGSVIAFVAFYITWGRAGGGAMFLNWGGMPPYALLIAIIGATSTFLLGKSVRQLTTLPNQFLDERQKETRNWAFRMTYKYLLRVAAVILTLAAVIQILDALSVMGSFRAWVDSIPSNSLGNGAFESSPWQMFLYGLLGALDSSTGNLVIYGGSFAYLAWALPIVLIAWNEAKHGGGSEL